MILAIDVGNTHVVLGCLEGREIRHVARLATDRAKTDYEYALLIRDVLGIHDLRAAELEGAILSSVVPALTTSLRSAVKILTGREPLLVGPGIKTGLNIRIDDPAQLGSDLLVGAVASLDIAEPPLIFIDMGTATTVCALDKSGAFLGGVIAPGLALSMNALSSHTSLPPVAIEAPKRCIGSNTVACMQSGAVFGAAAMLDGLIERMEEELGSPAAVIATGGLSGCVAPYCRREIRLEPELLLKGLAVLWEKNRDKFLR